MNYVYQDFTPLKNAIRSGSIRMAEELLKRGCDPHLTEPLLYIVTYGLMDFLSLFIAYGIDVTILYKHDKTALMVAAFYSRNDVVSVILPYYSSRQIRYRDEDGVNALMFAVMFDNALIVQQILDVCPEIKDDLNYDFKTVKEVAQQHGAVECLTILRKRSVPIKTTVISDYFNA